MGIARPQTEQALIHRTLRCQHGELGTEVIHRHTAPDRSEQEKGGSAIEIDFD